MLTKTDLQQIGNVVEEKLEERLKPVEKDLTYLKKKMRRMDKTLSLVARKFDEGDVALAKRIDRIENHLNLPSQG